jgi:L-aspartate oxidase
LKQAHDLQLEARLLSVDSRRVPLYRFDLLVVGSGAAGASAALAAAERGAEVALIAKGDLGETNTQYAQGGVAAVLDRTDSFESHVEDTLRVGCGLSELERVERVVRDGPAAIERLRRMGARFDLDSQGNLALEREGGHSHHRIVHAHGDATGRAVQDALRSAVQDHPRITVFSNAFALDLLCAPGGEVGGALVQLARGDLAVFSGGQVILATGGAGQIYRETTNPTIATGDGVAIAFRAGATLRDLEFYQFHPTMLYIAGAARVLISEIVRGAGGVLRDRQGARFMADYHEAVELAPRDVVSRAIFERMIATHDTNVYLDLSAVRGDPHQLFPGISRICRFFGIDIAEDPVPVRPGAHYCVGGIEVDTDGRTSVPGLWAVGECASSGLHGANRMGSNSLLECLVLGTAAGQEAADTVRDRGIQRFEVRPPRDRAVAPAGMQVNVQDVIYSLKSLMWRQLGIEREGPAMKDARTKIRLWTRAVQELAPQDRTSWECINMLTVSHLMALSADFRLESRGVHYRTDQPLTDPAWCAHTRLQPRFDDGRIVQVDIERVPVVAAAVARA